MLIKSKESKMHPGKVFEMREGVSGSGKTVFIVGTIVNHRHHSETFTSQNEAESWWKHACN